MDRDFLDGAVDKAKNLFNAACQKTDEVIAIEKLKIKQASYKNKVSKDYKMLGKLYFEKFKDNEDIPEDFKRLIKDIELNFSLIEKAQQDIEVIKESGVVL